MRGKVLIIVHQPTSTPGRVGLKLRERGFELDVRRPCIGEPLPETLEEHCGVIVFGGPMSANDCHELDFIRTEIDWLARPLEENVPFLGVCLGAQLLARQLGVEVTAHPEGQVEIGYYPLRPTPAGLDLVPEWPERAYQWHREGFDLPHGAVLLAEGNAFSNQAFRYGDAAYGVQFHPEVTRAMVHRWTVRGSHRLGLPGAKPRSAHLEDRLVYDAAVAAWLDQFLDRWLPVETDAVNPLKNRTA
ncbi:MAG: glutamine amidotransferase [Hyphomicrobiales bacterium]